VKYFANRKFNCEVEVEVDAPGSKRDMKLSVDEYYDGGDLDAAEYGTWFFYKDAE
jgi:hypothetical protein